MFKYFASPVILFHTSNEYEMGKINLLVTARVDLLNQRNIL